MKESSDTCVQCGCSLPYHQENGGDKVFEEKFAAVGSLKFPRNSQSRFKTEEFEFSVCEECVEELQNKSRIKRSY